MNIDKLIEQWEEKHSSLLAEYSKGNSNNEVMQMYRSQMKSVLDCIDILKQLKNNLPAADSGRKEQLKAFVFDFYEWHKKTGYATVKQDDWREYIESL